jgi:hypothetical protein
VRGGLGGVRRAAKASGRKPAANSVTGPAAYSDPILPPFNAGLGGSDYTVRSLPLSQVRVPPAGPEVGLEPTTLG